jgi:hypothetical protein
MNDRPNPNNVNNASSASDYPNSVEARLARAAQQLDTAAANYAYRTHADPVSSAPATPSPKLGNSARAPKRRFAPFAAIGGAVAFAGSLVFGASVISNQAEAPPKNVPIEVASPTTPTTPIVVTSPTSDFPFVGELRVSLPSDLVKSGKEELIFNDGVAISSIDQRRLTLAAAIDIDLEADGTKELAVLINLDAVRNAESSAVPTIPEGEVSKGEVSKGEVSKGELSKNSPSKLIQPDSKLNPKLDPKSSGKSLSKPDSKSIDAAPRTTSAVAIVRVAKNGTQTLAATPGFDVRMEHLLMNNKTLWSVQSLSSNSPDSGEAILRRAIIDLDRGVIGWSDTEQPIARTTLPRIVEGDKQIRFLDGTTSALVFAPEGARTGWFTAKAGQKLSIATLGVPSGKNRQVALQFRTGPNNKRIVSNGILPEPLAIVLPNTGEYEIIVGEGTAEATFELRIE